MRWASWFLKAAFLSFLVLGSAQAQQDRQGGDIYQQHCAVCHGQNGEGGAGVPLAGNARLDDDSLVTGQILHGGQAMPPFQNVLSDEQIAAVATFIRTSWNNDFGPITVEQVADRRAGGTGAAPEDQMAQEPAGQAAEQAAGQPAAGEEQAATPVTVTLDSSGDTARLVDDSGRALYRFVNDSLTGASHCYEPCTTHWLPVVVGETAAAGEGLEAAALGTVERDDGTLQATYRGWPLYRFVNDVEPGATIGAELSDSWRVVESDVEQLEPAAAPQ